MTRAALSILVAIGLLAQATAAQQRRTFRSDVQTVPIYATVTDGDGRLVPDLEREHFEIYDDGELQEITNFTTDVQPVSVVVMLDTSGSMTLHLDFLKRAAEQFVIRLLPDDRAKVGAFSQKIQVYPPGPFTSDRDALVNILRNNIQFGNPTALWDAIHVSMQELTPETQRKVVLIFTDGEDTASDLGRGDVVDQARAENVMIYGIGYESRFRDGYGRWVMGRPDRGLRPTVEETGGGYFQLKVDDDLGETFTRVADELHRQYVLGFTPQNLDGEVHKVELKVKVNGMRARARRSYLASPAGATVNPPASPAPITHVPR